MPFVDHINEKTKDSMVNFITNQNGGLIGSNAFSVVIDTKNVL